MTKIDTSTEAVDLTCVCERLADARGELDALKAENERLKAQVDTTWNEAIEAAVKLVNSMANDALTVAAREHAFQIAEAIGELKGESHE